MTTDILNVIEAVARLIITDPIAAADQLDILADLIKAHAHHIRTISTGHAPYSPGGLGDSCKIKVTGPDGLIKQEVSVEGV